MLKSLEQSCFKLSTYATYILQLHKHTNQQLHLERTRTTLANTLKQIALRRQRFLLHI